VARSGYVNLLQPQDRRSPVAGDSSEAIDARARLLAAGVGRTILDRFVAQAAGLDLPDRALVVELGSGAGEALGALALRRAIAGVGIDLSAAAASQAARRFPALTWVVANADRRLPLVDRSASLVLSMHARRNPAESARVLSPNGHLLLGVPAADDLIELRAAVMGDAVLRDRVEAVVSAHAAHFLVKERWTVRERHALAREPLLDLLRGTYRGVRTSAVERVDALVELDVTLSSDIVLLTPR
jgi:23S rRNA (guanine745-N1)-methyltransferase